MKILKYIFLLILLALVATTVYVATQKGDFNIERSKVIHSPKSLVFNYVNDYRNWENWGSWKEEDPEIQYFYPANTVGKGGSYSWKDSNGTGNMKTTFVKENDSIAQKMIYNELPSEVSWKFEDTIGGTKVTWRTKGKMDFMFKIYTAFKGGADNVIGKMYEKSLANLDKTLDYEMNTYSVQVDGIMEKPGCMYLQQTINSKITNLSKNLQIMHSKMNHFFKKNEIPMNGKPFVLYDTYDVNNGITHFSVCVPIKDEIMTSPGSDISFGKLESFMAVKITLKGDYSHRKEAWDKGLEYILANKLERNGPIQILEVYTRSMEEIKKPSQWITEIYIPIKVQPIEVKPVATAPRPRAVEVLVPANETPKPAPEKTVEP